MKTVFYFIKENKKVVVDKGLFIRSFHTLQEDEFDTISKSATKLIKD